MAKQSPTEIVQMSRAARHLIQTMRRQWVWIAFIIGFLAGGETAWQIAAHTMKHLYAVSTAQARA